MTPLFTARRAAEEFAGVIEGSRSDVADRYSSLTATIELLREQPAVEPRADFAADLRSRLMLAADTLLATVPHSIDAAAREGLVVPMPTRRQRLGTVAAAAFVVVGGTTSMAVAAQGALPGDVLYPVKRGIESAQSQLSTSDAGRGTAILGQASTRLDEVRSLNADNADTGQIEATLAAFEASANDGADLLFASYQTDGRSSDISTVREFAASNMESLSALADTAPASTQGSFASAAETLTQIDTMARVLCGTCGTDELGLPDDLSSASDLNTLVTMPTLGAAQAAADQRKEQAALAEAAEAASQDRPAELPTGGSEPDAASTLPDGGEVIEPKPVDSPLKQTTTATTDGVTGLLDQVTESTGGLTKPLTDGLNTTLEGTLGGTVDALDGLLR